MINVAIAIRSGIGSYDNDIEAMGAEAFGPGRFARAAFRLREGVKPDPKLSFVALIREDGAAPGKRAGLVGSVIVTPILIGGKPALLLGPLVVDPKFKNRGIGRELMNRAVVKARSLGHELMLLVGDEPYYGRFGFRVVPAGRIAMPGPVDPARLLAHELAPDCLDSYRGAATRVVQESNSAGKNSAR
jgi:predicted N-acetyltransferase YhbS